MTSPFLWRGQPSLTGERRKTDSKAYIPVPLTFSKRSHSSSIASAEKLKQRPGTGGSATA